VKEGKAKDVEEAYGDDFMAASANTGF